MISNLKISVIIRTYNEERHIEEVIKSIIAQNYNNYEIIVVDSESTDSTLNILKKYKVNIIPIKKADFNYSYASNIGAEGATGDILLFLSGHSVICKANYFTRLNHLFSEDSLGGCYGDVIPFEQGGIIEKSFYWLGYWKNFFRPYIVEKNIHPGILSCSNAAIRKKIWMEHAFVEALGRGGEDVEMAYYILNANYNVVFDRELLVKHSHHLKCKQFIAELKNWDSMWVDIIEYLVREYGYKK